MPNEPIILEEFEPYSPRAEKIVARVIWYLVAVLFPWASALYCVHLAGLPWRPGPRHFGLAFVLQMLFGGAVIPALALPLLLALFLLVGLLILFWHKLRWWELAGAPLLGLTLAIVEIVVYS